MATFSEVIGGYRRYSQNPRPEKYKTNKNIPLITEDKGAPIPRY